MTINLAQALYSDFLLFHPQPFSIRVPPNLILRELHCIDNDLHDYFLNSLEDAHS